MAHVRRRADASRGGLHYRAAGTRWLADELVLQAVRPAQFGKACTVLEDGTAEGLRISRSAQRSALTARRRTKGAR